MTLLTGLIMLMASAAPAPASVAPVAGLPTVAGVVPSIRCDAVVDDDAVLAAIQSRLAWSSTVDAADVRVSGTRGVVDVYGYVPDEAQKARVGRMTSDTYGVVRVNNRLDVVNWSPRTQGWRVDAESRRAGRLRAQEQSDERIVSALRFALSFSRAIDTCGIGVTAVNGVVSLRGEVPDQAGFDEAALLARDTLGVRSVDASGLAHRN